MLPGGDVHNADYTAEARVASFTPLSSPAYSAGGVMAIPAKQTITKNSYP